MADTTPPVAPARVCVIIGRTRHKMMLAELQEAAKQGAKFIELRLDFLARAPDFKRLLAEKTCPFVLTIRRQQDGGRWKGSEEQRQMLMRQAIVAGFDWVDLETDIADKVPRFRSVKRIVSYHNLREMPADLEDIHARMCAQDADVVKLAVRAMHPADNLRVLNLVRRGPKPTVAVCVGDLGIPSRILGAKFGAPFTYAAFNKERGIAPGILSFDEMRQVYHYDEINADTQVFGVIGDPVGHSLSPLVHNAALRSRGVSAVFVPFRVPRGDLPGFLREFEKLPVAGYSVTIPHKETAATLAAERDEFVELTQAANTLIRRGEGRFAAYNTDCQAAVDSLLSALSETEGGPHLSGRQVLLLGAGGVARAVAHGLHRQGALLVISNRSGERAQRLAEEVGCRACDWTARHSIVSEILVNCTSVGMHPHVDESPIHHSYLRPDLIVFDVVYTPETTFLIKEARERGCRTLTGVDMFIRQAGTQFNLYTGLEPPLELMRKVAKRALSPVVIKDYDEAAP
jgi:3-dehydroquinate dehydratase/shikimate dehydrogenase